MGSVSRISGKRIFFRKLQREVIAITLLLHHEVVPDVSSTVTVPVKTYPKNYIKIKFNLPLQLQIFKWIYFCNSLPATMWVDIHRYCVEVDPLTLNLPA